MSQERMEEVSGEVVQAIATARQSGKRGIAIVRCRSNREVDQAREMLRKAETNFPWKSQPISEIDPPDLIGYVVHRGGPSQEYAPDVEIHEGVTPAAGEMVVTKTKLGPFSTTGLDVTLRDMGKTRW